jgi:hypothetical protein
MYSQEFVSAFQLLSGALMTAHSLIETFPATVHDSSRLPPSAYGPSMPLTSRSMIIRQTLQTVQTTRTLQTVQTVFAGQDSYAIMRSVPQDKPRTAQPPSKRVETDIRARLARGEWSPGDRLPPVHELSDNYGVARSTIIAALRRIEADGLIEIVPNWGTFRK